MRSVKQIGMIIIFGVAPYFSALSFSQADTSKISYDQENADSSDFKYQRKYQYLDIHLKDETNMFKIALPTFSITYNKDFLGSSISKNNFGFLLTFERKVSQPLSIYVENENIYYREAFGVINDYQFTSTLNWGARYYIFINQRINERTSGNNCNGIYADLLIRGLNGMGYSKEVNDGAEPYKKNQFNIEAFEIPELRLNLGLQERLNNFSYMDARFYIACMPEKTDHLTTKFVKEQAYLISFHPKIYQNLTVGLDFRIGLGWGWDK